MKKNSICEYIRQQRVKIERKTENLRDRRQTEHARQRKI